MATRVAKGTVVKIDISGTATAVPGVTKITPPQRTPIAVETTDFDSADEENAFAGVHSNKGFAFTVKFDPQNTVHEKIHDAGDDGTMLDFTLIYPTAAGMESEFSALVEAKPVTDLKGIIMLEVSVVDRINGKVTTTIT